jgi:hypothetical protein
MATTFSTIYTAVMNRARLPVTNTTELTKVKRIINEVYRDLLFAEDWAFLVKRYVFNTASDFTHGTITVTSGSTAFTMTNIATSLGSFVDRKLHVSGGSPDSGAFYRIATHTADLATGLLDAAYTSDSTTGAAFHIYQDIYDLPSDFFSLVDLTRAGSSVGPHPVGPREMLQMKAADVTVGRPQRYSVFDYATTGDPTTVRQLWVHPYPDNTYRVEVFYRRSATDLSSDDDVPALPEEYRHVITKGALAEVYTTMLADSERGQLYRQEYQSGVARMASQNREVGSESPQIVPVDQWRGHFKRRRLHPGSMDLGSWFDRMGRTGP